MQLPPGPRAPAAWQTLGWMARPAAFTLQAYKRYGDPFTIRTYWTPEPMVLFSHPDAVREIFRLDPAMQLPSGIGVQHVVVTIGPLSNAGTGSSRIT